MEDVRRLRRAAPGAVFILALLLGTYWLSGREVAGPQPRREELIQLHGIVERMRIGKDDRGCFNLSVHAYAERGPVLARNTELCRGLRRLRPLPPGAPVTLLVERVGADNVVWEMTSGGRRLISYEQMHARRASFQRNHRTMGLVVALLCLPFAAFLAFCLWQEAVHLIGRRTPSGAREHDSGAG